ncbi:hypothetical protein BU16DRAFT_535478 [Lophium mytilinum]|uniref:Uncharacterized protein n=1 Tax=Lophium mytilinum TaxID=390894 RepID=A0A6A6R5P2_9PEZI|nr:hypothetical protein BU16DRAFT_535478 [Lophium mytilinum]
MAPRLLILSMFQAALPEWHHTGQVDATLSTPEAFRKAMPDFKSVEPNSTAGVWTGGSWMPDGVWPGAPVWHASVQSCASSLHSVPSPWTFPGKLYKLPLPLPLTTKFQQRTSSQPPQPRSIFDQDSHKQPHFRATFQQNHNNQPHIHANFLQINHKQPHNVQLRNPGRRADPGDRLRRGRDVVLGGGGDRGGAPLGGGGGGEGGGGGRGGGGGEERGVGGDGAGERVRGDAVGGGRGSIPGI